MSDDNTNRDAEPSPASGGSRPSPTDIIETLRECADDSRKTEGDYYADQFATDASVFDEAADEIERLIAEVARLRLTDAEREAIAAAVAFFSRGYGTTADTLRGLLERLG